MLQNALPMNSKKEEEQGAVSKPSETPSETEEEEGETKDEETKEEETEKMKQKKQ